jgi:hypothetical protein
MRFPGKLLALILATVLPAGAGANPHDAHAGHMMPGILGAYAMTREGSGTAWVPEATAMNGVHSSRGDWTLMTHGFITGSYTDQNGPRGDAEAFASSMGMLMAQRPWSGGTLGLRTMLSLDPLTVGKEGYPLLFQTGETADGKTHLVDRQHPHDLFAELSASYSREAGDNRSWFVYGGLPGEPALGPPTFMHRFSGMQNPEAPLSHHWLDSTHISFGVLTAGYVWSDIKLDASVFNGREPDQDRYDIETGDLDSRSVRVTWNPSQRWSLQASYGELKSPEQLEPDVDVARLTASLIHHRVFAGRHFESTLAWGRNDRRPGRASEAWLWDMALELGGPHTLFGRLEQVNNGELFDDTSPLHHEYFLIRKISLGYVHTIPLAGNYAAGLGLMASKHLTPGEVESGYGSNPSSAMAFLRLSTR